MWQAWIIAVLGLWVAIEPYLGIDTVTSKVLLLITGVIILILGVWGVLMKNRV